MPTYQYSCTQCESELEVFQGINDAHLTHCPNCSQDTLKRKVGGGMAILNFKGSGFYITDYSNKSSKSEESSKKTDTKKTSS